MGLNTINIPPAPDAAALGRYVETPVDLSTGSPQVQVPLLTLEGRSLSLPVGLSYHAGGIRVDDIATRIGLGWSLQAGGMISRTVSGMPDEVPGGYFATVNQLPVPVHPAQHIASDQNYHPSQINKLIQLAEGAIDGTPDRFNINFPGGNAQLVFDASGTPQLIPHQLLDIQVDWQSQTWTIRSPDGITYTFGGSAIESSLTTTNSSQGDISAVTAWYLTRIEDPFGDVIDLYYESDGTQCQALPETQTEYFNVNGGTCGPKLPSRTWGNVCTQSKRIHEIHSSKGKVLFEYDEEGRLDFSPSKALKNVTLLTPSGEKKQSYQFYHFYWSGRMMLDKVVEFNGAYAKPAHQFSYNDSANLPPIGSFQRDHWGYFNGKPNTSLVPYTEFGNCNTVGNASRDPDFQLGKLGLLNGIQFPTGGSTRFEFEAHTVWSGPSGRQLSELTTSTQASCNAQNPTCNTVGNSSFTITHPQCIKLQMSLTNPGGNPCAARVEIYNLNQNQIERAWNCGVPPAGEVYLASGNYELRTFAVNGGDSAHATATYQKESIGGFNRQIGGARLKKMITQDGGHGSPDIIREYQYQNPQMPLQSSGELVKEPVYLYSFEEATPTGSGSPTPYFTYCQYYGVQGGAFGINGNSGGSHIHYGAVKTLHGLGGSNGYQIDEFTTSTNHPDPVPSYPFGPEKSKAHLRGLPLQSSVFTAQGIPVSKQFMAYAYRNENKTVIQGFMSAFKKIHIGITADASDELFFRPYTLVSEWFHLESTTSRLYDENGIDYLESVETYHHDNPNHLQLSSTHTFDSQGNERITRVRYPGDYAPGYGDASASAITNLISQQFRHNIPIENTESLKTPSGTELILAGQLTTYRAFSNKVIQPHQVLNLETGTPLSDFSSSEVVNGLFVFDQRYTVGETALKYNRFGRPTEVLQKDGLRIGYQWGYGQTLPVAQIIESSVPTSMDSLNTASVINGSCAYTGFESGLEEDHFEDEGYWAFQANNASMAGGHTGHYARRIQPGGWQLGPLRELKPDPQTGKIVFSAWVKSPSGFQGGKLVLNTKSDSALATAVYPSNGLAETVIPPTDNQWTYVQTILDLDAIRSQGNIPPSEPLRIIASVLNQDPGSELWVDDLRVLPLSARMTTYTYDPLVGMTSQTDPNGFKASYQYDPLHRMGSAWDHQDYLRGQNSYHFAAQEVHLITLNELSGAERKWQAPTTLNVPNAVWSWDFGDGSTLTTQSAFAVHAYSQPGTYLVKVTVEDSSGNSVTDSQTLTVQF